MLKLYGFCRYMPIYTKYMPIYANIYKARHIGVLNHGQAHKQNLSQYHRQPVVDMAIAPRLMKKIGKRVKERARNN